MESGIYCITNTVNGKRYIGQALNIKVRWRTHKTCLRGGYHGNSHLQRAWKIYDEENFTFSILEKCEPIEETLTQLENYWINEFDTLNPIYGYNKREAGNTGKMSDESKNKISKSTLGKKRSEEAKKNIREKHADFSGKNHPHFGKKVENSSSTFFGVYYFKRDNCWRVRIRIQGKDIFVGNFHDEITAALAYDAYVIEHQLDRPLNFPEGGLNAKQ